MIFSRFVTFSPRPGMILGCLQRWVFRGVSCIQWHPVGPLWDEHLGCQAPWGPWAKDLGSAARVAGANEQPEPEAGSPQQWRFFGGNPLEIWRFPSGGNSTHFWNFRTPRTLGDSWSNLMVAYFFQVGWFNHQLDSFFWGHHSCCFFFEKILTACDCCATNWW